MNPLFRLFAAALPLVATGCAPKIYTSLQARLPARAANAEVLVYEPADSLPASAGVLGGLLIKNEKGSARCNYDEAMQLARNQTNRAGGNGLHITWHQTPAGPGQGHQLSAEILTLPDSLYRADYAENLARQQALTALYAPHARNRRGAQSEYRNNFFVNAGCGFIISEFLTGNLKSGNPKRGLDINAGYQYTARGIGFGLRYSGYYASAELFTYGKDRIRLHYFAPEFVLRQALSERWSINESIGVGYVIYRESTDGLSAKVGGFGYHVNLGIEYKIARGLGINLGTGVYCARFGSMDKLAQNYSDKKAGITRISLHGGLRFYF
ncbi:hypothetical protein [Alistipes sp.]|uniref:hypothetical protein n=1 Tax=Alistipes sp. TaxID=1872444 RepID=UPI003AF061A3